MIKFTMENGCKVEAMTAGMALTHWNGNHMPRDKSSDGIVWDGNIGVRIGRYVPGIDEPEKLFAAVLATIDRNWNLTPNMAFPMTNPEERAAGFLRFIYNYGDITELSGLEGTE